MARALAYKGTQGKQARPFAETAPNLPRMEGYRHFSLCFRAQEGVSFAQPPPARGLLAFGSPHVRVVDLVDHAERAED